MELLLLVFFCLLTGSEVTFGDEPIVITVKEGSDVILRCSLREDITNKKFVWKKDGRQVFLYDDRDHSNIVNTGQDRQFISRVEHFPDKLKSGDASITIRDMMVAETGNYTCEFPDLQPRQIFYVKLIVFVEAPQPSIRILEQKGKIAVLQCEVRGAFPKPEFYWEDGARKKLPAEKQESERQGLYDIILQTIVTKTDNYRCVATQKEINHQTHAETFVSVPEYTAGEIVLIVIGVLVFVVAVVGLAVYKWRVRIMSYFRNGKAKPSVTIFEQTDAMLLQCEVRGAFPKPELHWEDGDGNKLSAEKPQESEREGLYDIILQTTVYKAGIYRCVATQKEINHQAHADIPVDITGTTITVDEGGVITLPCSLREDITNKKFVWMKDGRQVFLYDAGDHSNTRQDQLFIRRVEHFPDELKSGDASITIRDMKLADSGLYTCEFPDLQPRQIFYVRLVVEPTVIRVDEGRYVTLPCSLPEDITNKKFVWMKDGLRRVFLYDAGDHSNTRQDQLFKGRVEHFPDELKSGDASIIIRNMKVADSGVYTCDFPDIQPRQIFYIDLIVAEPEIITVVEGRDVTLRCSLYPEDITNKKFEWMKDGRQVFLYDDGDHSNTGQDQWFKGRVSHFSAKLKSGSASITIRNTQWLDRGYYICRFPDLQSEQIFRMKLIVVGPEIISVKEGSVVTLPCSLREDITNKKFVWMKDGLRRVFLYDDGDHSNIVNTGQDQLFKGRVEHFRDKLKSGDASITIRDMKVADSGLYICRFPDLQPEQTFRIQLVVGPKVITVVEGRDVTLRCSLNTTDITNKKFEWKEDDRQVFLYDDRDHSNIVPTGQDQQFEGRVSHFPDKLKSGNASIIIRNTKVADSGDYTCNFPDLQPSQIFYVKLIVVAVLTPPGKGSAQDPKKTEPAATTSPTAPGNGSAQDPKKTAPNPRNDEAAGLLTGKTDGRAVDEADSLV